MRDRRPLLVDPVQNPDLHRLLKQRVGYHPEFNLPDFLLEKLDRLEAATNPPVAPT